MVLPKAGSLQRLAITRQLCVRCIVRQRRAECLLPRPVTRTPTLGQRSLSTTRTLRSIVANEVKDENSTEKDPPTATEVQMARLNAEYATTNDIRYYLRRWQEIAPQNLDSVHEPGSATALNAEFVMMNGRGETESVRASSQLTDQTDLDMSEEFEGDHLEPGDMVSLIRVDGTSSLAIYVQSTNRQKQFYTERGMWRACSAGELDYVLKGFAPTELLEPIKPYFPNGLARVESELQSTPEGGLPRPLGAPLLEMMGNFQDHMMDFCRDNAQRLDKIYDITADETEFLRLTLEELTMKVLDVDESELTAVSLYAVHQAVRNHPFLIEKDSNSLFSSLYLVQPKRIATAVEKVTTWVHEHQNHLVEAIMVKSTPKFNDHPMQMFIQKAQRLIRLSRKVRSPTIMSSVGPTTQQFEPGQDGKPMLYREVLTEKFTDNDRIILEYLQLYAIPSVIMPSGTLRSAASHIMRATGMYNTLGLSEASTRLFLQEIGVIAPWENLGLLDQSLLLPGHGMSLLEDMRWEEIEESCRNLSLTDSMQGLRKDWSDLPVYCIDDVNAQEIDDGVSLERIPGSDDTFWIRIHVANPTAFLHHNDPTIEYAGSRWATTYAPERTYPIFPTSLTQGNFSLSPGRPTLTFSAKMNLQGEILDTEVTNGTVRNIINVTHSKLRDFFIPDKRGPTASLKVGGTIVDQPLAADRVIRETLTPEDEDTFTLLRKLMLGFRTQRQKNGAMDMQRLSPNLSVSVQMGTAPTKPYEMQVTEGRYFIGDPIIQLRMHDFDAQEVPDESKENLVSLLMNLAGHIAGQFCATRNIPAVFDGTWYDPEYARVTRDNIAQYGGKNFLHFVLPKALSASSPIKHHFLGINAYVKSTSPLRRFTDVIAHYQIEAALRFEHENGRQFNAAIDMPEEEAALPSESEPVEDSTAEQPSLPLPYTKADVENLIHFGQTLKTRLKEVSSFSTQHWACMLLFRAFYFAECELPPSFRVILRVPRLTGLAHEGPIYSGVITNLGVKCVVTIPEHCPGREDMDVFGVVDATITAVDMAKLEVKMEATRLVSAFQRKGEWA
ncbi:uncharacterized protein N7498_006072 [Penicillium cinerascens]|uniref:RNB domain-containing protein n=1 Tax=Penicillium cinerascens TaxID=70096 RepID=A0A9W9SWU3_9EURO|nr:uncharacterized protein N7498_006072 [Penicillium cinerascens]KAJ5201409.1 hypothetical protein N7498_006072 [Penicillium cinerascens]